MTLDVRTFSRSIFFYSAVTSLAVAEDSAAQPANPVTTTIDVKGTMPKRCPLSLSGQKKEDTLTLRFDPSLGANHHYTENFTIESSCNFPEPYEVDVRHDYPRDATAAVAGQPAHGVLVHASDPNKVLPYRLDIHSASGTDLQVVTQGDTQRIKGLQGSTSQTLSIVYSASPELAQGRYTGGLTLEIRGS